MAQAEILKMQGDFEVMLVIIWQFDVLSLEGEAKILLTKVKIVVDPCYLFTPLPSIAVDLNEDIREK